MKEIMISIQPQWVEKILNGEKTIEIRKTMPKCELPCKVYIYCTQAKNVKENIWKVIDPLNQVKPFYSLDYFGGHKNIALNGKVVAEFTLNNIETIEKHQVYNASVVRHNACLNIMQLHDYIKGKRFHAWHIDNLKIYDKPKELSEFYGAKECPYKDWGDIDNIGCWEIGCEMFSRGECRFGHLRLDIPPQSWYYVEKE